MLHCLYRQVKKGPHVVWIDNFSKTLGRQIPNMAVGTWSSCLWTGICSKQYTGVHDVSMDLIRDDHDDVIPAMPEALDDHNSVDAIMVLFENNKITPDYHLTSLVTEFKIDSAPVKAEPRHVANPHWKAFLQGEHDTIDHMYPESLRQENIGSNLGLGRIMRDHYTKNLQYLPNFCLQYTAFSCDIDIFNRIMKVSVDAVYFTHHSQERLYNSTICWCSG